MKKIGCVPPYFYFNQKIDQSAVCKGNVTIDPKNIEEVKKLLSSFSTQVYFLSKWDLEVENCVSSCDYMTVETLILKDQDGKATKVNWGSFKFAEDMDIITDTSYYDEFALLVEAGT